MRFAEVDGKRCEATKRAKGICPFCKGEVIAKCGEQKIAHWAHKSTQSCDSWHEKETDWHLMWKNYFPKEWQEIIKTDEITGEKHIADVCTDKNFVFEFQHSAITPEERQSREQFYKNMNWVVDGTRLKNDYEKFSKAQKRYILPIKIKQYTVGKVFTILYPEDSLPKSWLNSNVPVIFDFKGLNKITNPQDLRNYIFCLLPKEFSFNKERFIIQVPISIFIESSIHGSWQIFIENQTKPIKQFLNEENYNRAEKSLNYNNTIKYNRPRGSRL